MKKFLLSLLLLTAFVGTSFAAGPAIEEGNMIQFTAADQITTTVFRIRTLVWISAAGSEIAGTNGFLLEDGAGTVIAGGEATALSDQVIIHFGDKGVVVSGLKAEDLDAGYLYIYGSRK